jgi:hypothetical protein
VAQTPHHTYHLRSGTWQRYNTTSIPGPQLWIGATVTNGSASNAIQYFQAANNVIGPLRMRRTFSSLKDVASFPASIANTDAVNDVNIGINPFLSVKADATAVVNGDFDAKFASLAASFPTSNAFLSYWHEPEGDMAGSAFVAAFQRFYTVCKTANPGLNIGPIHMGYQWRAASLTTTTPDDWWVGSGYCDYLAVDSYWDTFNGTHPKSLQNDPQHMRWHNWASAKGKALVCTERGVHPNGAEAAAVLLQDEIWLKANGYIAWMYWDAIGTGGKNWLMDTDPDMAPVWQQIASRGRSS